MSSPKSRAAPRELLNNPLNERIGVTLATHHLPDNMDRSRYHGGCYRAANWIELGPTSGRGRMDRANRRQGAAVKTVLVYPLVKDAAARLRQER